jgi:hypothetical protein
MSLLQKMHKNDIFRAIQAVGLDPKEFDLDDFDDTVRIKYRWSASYFIVSRRSGYYAGESLVGDGIVWPTGPSSWQALMPRVSWWLQEVKQDLDTPDGPIEVLFQIAHWSILYREPRTMTIWSLTRPSLRRAGHFRC